MALEILKLSNSQASAGVCPERGGLVTQFRVGDEELLYLDEATFQDASKNVRGGIPLLFPIAGPPPPASPMSQHGFARTSSWSTVSASDSGAQLRLTSSAVTREKFPYDFRIDFKLRLEGATLNLTWTVRADSDAMPLQFGLHPYFSVPAEVKAAARVDTDASRAWNNVTKTFDSVQGSPGFGQDEIDLHLLDHSETSTVLHRGPRPAIRLRWSTTFKTLVLWTQPGRPFVCVEPWSAPAFAARAGEALPRLDQGDVAEFALQISL